MGNKHPKKNTRGVLKAYADYVQEAGSVIKLVMIDYDKVELKKILQEIGAPELMDHICLTGYITNTDLPAIYSQCEVFLYPSLRESFGIPVIEAMACGAAVISSNTSSMPEVAGSAACLVDPYNTKDITNAMVKLTAEPFLRNILREFSTIQAAKFSWRKMAGEVWNMYSQMAVEQGLQYITISGNLRTQTI